MEATVGLVIVALIAGLVWQMRNPSAVRIVEISRPGKDGRYRWKGIDETGTTRTVPTKPDGWPSPQEAVMDGLAVYPRATIREQQV